MESFFFSVKEFFLVLGETYGVNPWIFGAIYVGAIPFFFLSLHWLVRRYRSGKSIFLPVLAASSCFVSAYVYLLIVGKNVPVWVYIFLVMILIYSGWNTYRNIEGKLKKDI